ncbi:MAG: SPFH domain-containing protein [Candidatus Falkowbacteria bacterium]
MKKFNFLGPYIKDEFMAFWFYWLIAFFVMALSSFLLIKLLGILVIYFFPKFIFGTYSILSMVALFSLFVYHSFRRAYLEVEENVEMVVEVQKKYYCTFSSGPHLMFPFFNIMSIKNYWEMFEGSDKIFVDDKNFIEFKSGASARIDAYVFWKVIDTYKATYNINNVQEAIRSKMESSFRSYLSNMTFEEANADRSYLNLPSILSGEKKKKDDESYKSMAIYTDLYNNWGVQITGLTVVDLIISDEIKSIRQKQFLAESSLKASEFTAKEQIVLATADRDSILLKNEAFADEIKKMTEAGMRESEVAMVIRARTMFKDGVPADTVLMLGGDSANNLGAGFGFGMGAQKANSKYEKKS